RVLADARGVQGEGLTLNLSNHFSVWERRKRRNKRNHSHVSQSLETQTHTRFSSLTLLSLSLSSSLLLFHSPSLSPNSLSVFPPLWYSFFLSHSPVLS